ncbi:hypothetical protein DI09_252p10, partial [Mitosporidium daphniae]
MFKYLVEIGNGVFGMKEHVFFRDLKLAYDQFQIVKKKNILNAVPTHIADNRGIGAYFSKAILGLLKLGSLEKLSAKDTFYCELPYFEYEDCVCDAEKFFEFSDSILHFLNNEIAYQPCFLGEKIPLISYLDSLTFGAIQKLEIFHSSNVEKMDFLYTFFMKIRRLLDYENDQLMYQKTLILFEIFKTYKEIYIRHLRTCLKNDVDFGIINDRVFEGLSPSFFYSNEIDLLRRKLPEYVGSIWFSRKDGEITSKLVSILFKGGKDLPNPDEMGNFFNVDMIKDLIGYASDYDYDPEHLERMAYIFTVISNPISIENSNNTVLPEAFLLDRHYYNLLHMLCKVPRHYDGAHVFSPIAPFGFQISINHEIRFELETDGYDNAEEIASLLWKGERPLKLMNLKDKFSSIFYFLNYLQEDHAFILSDFGMKILYTFMLKPSTYADDDTKKALPPVIQYFLSRKEKILAEIFINRDDIEMFRLLATCQIILNRLMLIQKRNFDIGGLEHAFVGKFQPIFAFIKLNTLILGERAADLQKSHDLYLSVISNFELIKSFFFKEEIQYVLRMYYDHWKFQSSKSRCAAKTTKGIQNLVNGNFLIDGERIQHSGLPFPSHRLWEMMNAKEKRDYNVEVTLHKRQSDGSIFSILKFNHMHFTLHEKDAFLFKENEITARLVSEYLNLYHEKLNLRVAFNSKMVGSNDPIIAFQTDSDNPDKSVYLFDPEGFEYGEVSGGNTLVLKNSSKFIGELSTPTPCSFRINSFCSFSSKSQLLLDALLTRGVLFNFAMDSYIFTLENEAQSFYFFNSYNGTAKDFYVMKNGSDEYFAVIKGEKFRIHPPAGIEGNFLVSSNLPFLFVSVEKSFQIIIPVPMLPFGKSYKFTFVKTTCKDDHFNIEGHDREIDLAIVY